MSRTNSHFTVFGGSYVPECHLDHHGFDIAPTARAEPAALLAVPFALIAGISVFAAQIAYLAGAHRLLEAGLLN